MSTPEAGQRFSGLPAILLALTVVLAAALAGMLGGELYARHRANSLVADAVRCEAQDSATVSFGTTPPVLAQYFHDEYRHISVQTAGNQIRQAKGMRLDLDIRDVRLNKGSEASTDSKGTVGALDGTITWPADGIKQSIQDVVPMIGSIVTGSVTTDLGAGTVRLKGLLNKATVKPQLVNNGLSLQVVDLEALGRDLDTDSVQRRLDELTAKVTDDLPLGIHLDSVEVTDSAVVVKFSTRNADIPASSSSECFGSL
ncbi:LmeA family phospholipid-binding protein [Mycolicibacter minnesotensis]